VIAIHGLLGNADAYYCAAGFENPKEVCFPQTLTGVPVCSNSVAGSRCCDTFPDGTDNAHAVGCAAALQGSNRLQRGLLYAAHLRDVFGATTPAAQRFLF
jgi:hypothetical protein